MNEISTLLADKINKIERVILNKDISSTNTLIAKSLLERFKNAESLPKLSVLSIELNLSNSSISKFLKIIDVENYQILKYLFDMKGKATFDEDLGYKDFSEKVKEAAVAISNAKRIRFMATGNSLLMIRDFASKLAKRDFNVFVFNSEADQLEQLEKLDENDVLVILSFSMVSKYIKDTVGKKCNFNKIVFSSQPEKSEYDAMYFTIGEAIHSKFRKDTFDERIDFLKKADAIIKLIDVL